MSSVSSEPTSVYQNEEGITVVERDNSDLRYKVPFYYDRVLLNRLTSVSLHANSVLDTEVVSESTDSETGETTYTSEPKKDWNWISPTEEVDDEGYMKRYLIKAPLLEDYNVSVRNNWSEFGDDAIGKMWNNLKPYAPYVGHFSKMLGSIVDTNNEVESEGGEESKSFVFGYLKNLAGTMQSMTSKAESYLNRSLIVQGARFSYYSGTSTSFGNLSMKFTVFSGWTANYYTGEAKWKTVDDQLKGLYPYVMGKYKKCEDAGEILKGLSEDLAGKVSEFLNQFVAFQYPPAGYKPDVKNVDNCNFGTLKLKFGAFYSLSSLVCTNAQFNFSKQMVKQWDSSEGKNKISPLYCDVVLNFQPATKYSDDAMKRFMTGKEMEEDVSEAKKELKKRLNNKQEEISSFLSGTGTLD